MIRVLVADDFPLVREAVAAALGRDPGIEVVGTAEDGAAALAGARELLPDVIVLDIRMPGMSGMTALGHLTTELPQVRVLLLTAAAKPDVLIDAVSAGAVGYLEKRVSGPELAEAVMAVHRGETAISPALMTHIVSGLSHRDQARSERTGARSLTETERSVLGQVGRGRTDREIAQDLFMSPRTVQSTLCRIRGKLGVRGRTALARWAFDHEIT